MEINYKVRFEKLMDQVKLELGWAEQALDKENDNGKARFYNGMATAYGSIKEFGELIEKGFLDGD